MDSYPPPVTPENHVAPAPRRVRGLAAGRTVFDTTAALYVWEWPPYPQYYVLQQDVDMSVLSPRDGSRRTPQGTAREYDVWLESGVRERAARLLLDSPVEGVAGRLRFDWASLDQWFEEDEEVFVHPRSPYVRVDALRSRRRVRVELCGAVLADSPAPVCVFETGLPTRYYVDRGDIDFDRLVASETRTACPYKGRTTSYWSATVGGTTHADLAWSYAFPTRQVLPIAGLVAFLNEKVDVFVEDELQERPETHMT